MHNSVGNLLSGMKTAFFTSIIGISFANLDISENNEKIFIEALNETMKDLNQKLTEQFGENFIRLNIAVGRLLVRQKNYALIIDAVKNSVAEIEESAASITKSSEQIFNLIVTANMYEQKLQKVLSEIKSVSENTSESLDDLKKNCESFSVEEFFRGMNDDNRESKLEVLCYDCHQAKHNHKIMRK